jgi:chromosome partitioning protein
MSDELPWSQHCGAFALLLERMQRRAIERENAPEMEKVLRSLTVPEVSTLLDLSQGDVVRTCRENGIDLNSRVSFADLVRLRDILFERTGDWRFNPGRRDGEALASVVFANFKGGSGKTTSSVHFAQYMARRGYRVLLIDLDSQGSATGLFGLDPGVDVGERGGFAGWVLAEPDEDLELDRLVRKTYWPTIDLVPAGPGLSAAEDRLTARLRGFDSDQGDPFAEMGKFLETVGGDYDISVVDVRPDVNILMSCAHQAADGLVVPVRPMMGDLQSTMSFFRYLAAHYQREEGEGARIGRQFVKVLVTQFDPNDGSEVALVTALRKHHPELMLEGEFLDSRVMGSSHYAKETLFEYEPQGDRAAHSRVLASVNTVCRSIERELVAKWKRPRSQIRKVA